MTQEVTSPIRTDFLDNWPSKTPEELSDIFRAISNSHQHPARFRPNPKEYHTRPSNFTGGDQAHKAVRNP